MLVNPKIVNLAGRDLLEPEARKVTVYKGWPARVMQHEIDHLNGVFFIDRCGPVGRALVLGRYGRWMKEAQE